MPKQLCQFGPCDGGRKFDRATHLVVVARTDIQINDETLRLCASCAKRYVGGSIEVVNGPHLISVVRL